MVEDILRIFYINFKVIECKNIFFFGDVITKFGDINKFSKLFHEISRDEDRLFDQLGQQVYVNSKIAALKFKYVNRALRFLALGLVFLLIITAYYFIVFS